VRLYRTNHERLRVSTPVDVVLRGGLPVFGAPGE
jgi:hypothetical protein